MWEPVSQIPIYPPVEENQRVLCKTRHRQDKLEEMATMLECPSCVAAISFQGVVYICLSFITPEISVINVFLMILAVEKLEELSDYLSEGDELMSQWRAHT